MRIECAWCGATIHAGYGQVSHGICERCKKRHGSQSQTTKGGKFRRGL